MRVAYQAGVFKALGEFGLRFAHGDGTSGGTMNLAMLLSGLSPDAMCERWRTLDVLRFSALMPIDEYLRSWDMMGVASSKGIREYVYPHLGIDVAAINRSSGMTGTFNVCNFSRKTAEVISGEQLSLDLLVAGISLPIFMPAVQINGDWYTDAVWIKDANLMTAVSGGSEELWIVWCIGNTTEYLAGAFNQYVHMIEMAGNGRLIVELEQIGEINRKRAASESLASPAKPVKVHIVKPRYPLPLDPDFFLGKITASTLINMGYADTCRYIEKEMRPEGVALNWEASQMKVPGVGITFSKTMKGTVALETAVGEGRVRVVESSSPLTLHLTVRIVNLDAFLAGDSSVTEISGDLVHPVLGGCRPFIEVLVRPKEAGPDADHFALDCRFWHNGSQFRLVGNIRRATYAGSVPVIFSEMPFRLDRIGDGGGDLGTGVLKPGGGPMLETARTLHVTNASTFTSKVRALFKFGRLFLRSYWA
jgi:hypothetical protein